MQYPLRHLASYLEASAAGYPERIAVVGPDSRGVTYRDLDATASRVAGFLQDRSIGADTRVGILMPKSVETITAIFGVLKAGAAYVPVDPTAPVGRGRTIFSDCRVSALFVHCSLIGILDGWDAETRPNEVVIVPDADGASPSSVSGCVSWNDVLAHDPAAAGPRGTTELAYILYTSGSTGIPKGVQISHGTASAFVEWGSETFSPTHEDRFSSHAPLHFDLSIFDLYVAIKHGASVHLVGEELTGNPRQLAQFIGERDITMWYSTPSALTLLAQHGRLERLEYKGPRIALFAGEVFPVKHLRRMTELWPAAEWFNLYGPTETNVCTYAHIPLPVPADRTEPYPIGFACAHCDALVLRDDGTVAAPGQEGALYIAGDSVFQGYWNRPAENARAFKQIDGRRYYDTGDVVRADERGEYIFLGRRDRMVKRRGYRIELGEIETALYRHPQLKAVGVVSTADETGVRIVACYTSEEPAPSIVDLKQFCSGQLPTYMTPDEFRRFDTMPSTSTGKTDYQQLRHCLTAQEERLS
jgi:amino acid adenylation domain-containing protein